MKNFLMAAILSLIGSSLALAQSPQPACPYQYSFPAAVTASTQLSVSLPAAPYPPGINGYRFRVCKAIMQVTQGATPYNFSLISGTGSVCATNTVQMTQIYIGVVSSTQIYSTSVDATMVWTTALGANLCLSLTGAPIGANIQIWYGIQQN
jgi:hypothetical protein